MIINMLEAVSEMITLKDSDEALASIAKVESAKIMLDKIIQGMMDNDAKKSIVNMDYAEVESKILARDPIPTLPTPKRKAKPGEVEVVVDAGIIKAIKNAQDDTMIQLDGKAMKWKEAIGKSFTEGKLL